MDPTHRDRQDTYRFWHPQLNITFHGRLEYREVQRALQETGRTPRQILVQWAHQVVPIRETGSPAPSKDLPAESPES